MNTLAKYGIKFYRNTNKIGTFIPTLDCSEDYAGIYMFFNNFIYASRIQSIIDVIDAVKNSGVDDYIATDSDTTAFISSDITRFVWSGTYDDPDTETTTDEFKEIAIQWRSYLEKIGN